MSIAIMTKVWKHSKTEGPLLLLMLALADHADDDGFCYPGVTRLAGKCRLSHRSIQRHIRTLCEKGELRMDEGRGAVVQGGVTNRYRILVISGDSFGKTTQNGSGDTPCAKVVTVLAESGDKAVSPKPSLETPVKSSGEEKPKKPLSKLDLIAAMFSTPSAVILPTSRKTKTNRNAIPPLLEDVTDFYTELEWHEPAALAAEFHDHHTSSGWKLKTGKMKDWQASARTWMRNAEKWAKPGTIPQKIAYFDNGLPDATPVIRAKLMAMVSEVADEGNPHAQFLVESGYGS